MMGNDLDAWVVLGGLHMDLSCDAQEDWWTRKDTHVKWVTWRMSAGGVAANLAQVFDSMNIGAHLLAFVGDDGMSEVILDEVRIGMQHVSVRPCKVPGATTGTVVMTYLGDAPRRRVTVAPEDSAVDVVEPARVREEIDAVSCTPVNLAMDGYFLRRKMLPWLDEFEVLHSMGHRINIELLPHTLWRQMTREDFVRACRSCVYVSSSMSTVEKILGIAPVLNLDPADRAIRLLSNLPDAIFESNCQLSLRFGLRDSQFALLAGNRRPPKLVEYDICDISALKSNQDRLFIHEIVGRPLNRSVIPLRVFS